MQRTLAAAAFLAALSSPSLADIYYWVSPTGSYQNNGTSPSTPTTLEGARDKIRATHPQLTDTVQVILQQGIYYRTDPFILSGPDDSGNADHRIIYRADVGSGGAGYANVMIHGGFPTWGWQQGPAAGGGIIWTMNPYVDADSKGGDADSDKGLYPPFRDLYYRNRRLIRSRFPNIGETGTGIDDGYLTVTQGWTSTLNGQPARGYQFTNFNSAGRTIVPGLTAAGAPVEMVARLPNAWTTPRQILGGATYGPAATPPTNMYFLDTAPIGWITTSPTGTPLPCVSPNCNAGWSLCNSLQIRGQTDNWCPAGTIPSKCFFENALAFVDSLYEWHYNDANHTFTVILPVGENPNVADYEIVFPMATQLLTMNNVQSVTFNRLNWGFTRFDLPAGGYRPLFGGYGPGPTNNLSTYGALAMSSVDDIIFTNCRIAHTGASALQIDGDHIQLQGNKIFDVGAHGIVLGNRAHWNVSADAGQNNIILHNQVLGFGRVYHDSLGIQVNIQQNSLIQANEVGCGGYSGISEGVVVSPLQSPYAFNNQLFNNRVHHVCRKISDGGGLHISGGMPNCEMKFNYVCDVSGGRGLFFDEGALGPWTLGWNMLERCTLPIGFHTGDCNNCTFPEPFNAAQYTWSFNYSDLTPVPAWNVNITPHQLSDLYLYPFNPPALPPSMEYLRVNSGIRCDYNYSYQFFNRQIDPPGSPTCATWPPNCDEYTW